MTGNWRTPLNIGLVLLLGVVALGFLITWGIGAATDRDLLKAVALRQGRNDATLIATMQWLTWAGDASQRSLFAIGCAGWLLWKQRVRAAAIMIVVPPLAGVTCSLLKEAFARARPDVVPHLDTFSNLSFPSGHAANPMTILLLAALILPKTQRGLWLVLAAAAGIVIGITRPLLGVHWPSDIAGGWMWGTGWALIGLSVARRFKA